MAGLDPAIHVFVAQIRKQDVDHRDKPGDDDRCNLKWLLRSLILQTRQGILAARFARGFTISGPPLREGAGNAGRFNRTHSLREKARRSSPQVRRKRSGIPRANGFNGFLRARPGDRAFCLRHLVRCVSIATKLDISVGISGPHDFAVRLLVHSSLAPKASTASRAQRFVTIAKRPSCGRETRVEVPVICPTPQAKNSATHWHDGQIGTRPRQECP
jgi:hypothetical protein